MIGQWKLLRGKVRRVVLTRSANYGFRLTEKLQNHQAYPRRWCKSAQLKALAEGRLPLDASSQPQSHRLPPQLPSRLPCPLPPSEGGKGPKILSRSARRNVPKNAPLQV